MDLRQIVSLSIDAPSSTFGPSRSAAEDEAVASSSSSATQAKGRVDRPGDRQAVGARKKRSRAQLSCDRCRQRKRKCDRGTPCSECFSINAECSFDRATQTSNELAHSRERRKAARRKGNSALTEKNVQATNMPEPEELLMGCRALTRLVDSHSSGVPERRFGSTGEVWRLDESPAQSSTSPDTNTTSPGSSYRTSGTASTSPSSVSSVSSSSKADVEALIHEPGFFERIMKLWYRELEWMADCIRNSPFECTMNQNYDLTMHPKELMDRYKGLALSIVSLTALVLPTDVDAILINMTNASRRHGFYSAATLARTAFDAAERWIDDYAKRVAVEDWNVEVFQMTLVHGMCIKYTGNWILYRERNHRETDRMYRAKFHRLLDMTQDFNLTHDEIVTRYCVFWRYYGVDRISSLFDGIPYLIQAKHADTWLFSPDGDMHIRTLCQDFGGTDPAAFAVLPQLDPVLLDRLRHALTPYLLVLTKLGGLAGRCSDRLNSLTQATLSENYIRAEHIAAEVDDELQLLESQISFDKLSSFERPMVDMTIARIRRDVSTRLSRHIARQHRAAPNGEEALVETLNRRCLNTAKSLIRRVSSLSGSTPIRAIAMPFFTLFIAETALELLTHVEQKAAESTPNILHVQKNGAQLDWETKDDLRYAIIGRNLLALLSRTSEMDLNKMITHKSFLQVQSTLQKCVAEKDAHLYDLVLSDRKIIDPEVIIGCLPMPRHALSGTESTPQRAEDVLNFLGSLTSLQRTFEMCGDTWSTG